jgi:hypothetical protein
MTVLLELLEDGIRFDPHYLPSMNSDHMPMTLCAMSALGADDTGLVRYRDDYAKILRPVSAAGVVKDWRDGAGDMGQYPGLLIYFRGQIAELGIESVVREYLPQFVHSLIAEAFHPLIRLGYAIDFASPAETAASLAYMAASTFPVPVDMHEPIDLEELLSRQAAQPIPVSGSRFGAGIRQLLDQGIYPRGIAVSFADCAAHSLDIYRSTRNFFALHMVTATQAARICAGYVSEPLVLASLTGALLAAHRAVGSPGFDRDSPLRAPDQLDREHIYKYIHACVSEYKTHGDPRYLEEVQLFRQKNLIADWVARDFIP